MSEDVIRVSEWTTTPGPRYKAQGEWSAEAFREQVLRDRFAIAVHENRKLTIDLDGAAGYLASFLEETFGWLSRQYGTAVVRQHLDIVCNDDPVTVADAWDYVDNARPPKRRG